MTEQDLSLTGIKAEVSKSVQQDTEVRPKVRDLTLQGLNRYGLEPERIKEVVKAVMEGISEGLDKRAGEIAPALSQAIAGLDEALNKSAQATQLALEELTSHGKEFADQDLKLALDNLKKTEHEFLSIMGQVANAAGGKVKQAMQELTAHVQRAGTDTGRMISTTLGQFGDRLGATLHDARLAGTKAARNTAEVLARRSSEILSGWAEALREKSKRPKPQNSQAEK